MRIDPAVEIINMRSLYMMDYTAQQKAHAEAILQRVMWYLLQCQKYEYWRERDGSTVDYDALEALYKSPACYVEA